MKFKTRAAALGLAALLLLPAGALAAEAQVSPSLSTAQKQEDLDFLYDSLKEQHPSLFANTAEPVFLAKKAEIESRLDAVSDLEFSFELQSLTALAGDSHTSVSLSGSDDMRFYPFSLSWFDGSWVLSTVDVAHADGLGKTVTALNGIPMNEVLTRFSAFVSADNGIKLRRQARQLMYAADILAYLGLAVADSPLVLTLRDEAGTESTLTLHALLSAELDAAEMARLSASIPAQPATAYKKRYYFSFPLNEDAYYIQYNRCQQDPDLPMEDFAAQVAVDLEDGAYTQVLLDLRNNGGGSDGVLMPLLNLLSPKVRDGSIQLWGLIGETTFSSAVINAVMIREMGGLLAGSPTSGSVDHFGSVGSFTLPNSGLRVGCSSKMISLSGLLEAAQGCGVEPLLPDAAVEQTLEDYLAGKDTLVDALSSRAVPYEHPDQSGLSLTRGRLLTLLYEAAVAGGADTAAPENGFYDVLPFAYYTPAVNWAAHTGITLGDGGGAFHAARPVTRAEAVVLLDRFMSSLALSLPEDVQEIAFTDESSIPAWALESVRRTGGLGLADSGAAFHPNDTLTQMEGQALVDRLTDKS